MENRVLKKGTLLLCVWEENLCDYDFDIVDSHGFSLETLSAINEDFQDVHWDEYRDIDLIVEPIWNPAQVGNYTPPNVEVESHWDFNIIEKKGRY